MGSRANYVITQDGRHDIYYSHWGAQEIDCDFFFGPDVALRLVRSLTHTSDLLDTVWAEGGAIVDLDRRRLKLWGGEDMRYDVRLRQLWLEMLRIVWESWDVFWAEHGIIDIADHMGIPRDSVRPKEPELDGPPNPVVKPNDQYYETLASVRASEVHLRDLLLPALPSYYLAAGPSLLPLLAEHPTQTVPSEEQGWPPCCLAFDVASQTMSVCGQRFGVSDPRLADELLARWPGWQVHLHHGGVPRHLELTGRDPRPLQRPVDDHIKELAQIIQRGDRDPASGTAALLANLPSDIQSVEVNPRVYQYHQLDMPVSRRMDVFLRVLSVWQSRRGADF